MDHSLDNALTRRLANLRLSSGFVLAGFILNAGVVVLVVAALSDSTTYALVTIAIMAAVVGGLALFADRFLLNRVGARGLGPDEFPWLEPMVRELSVSASMAMPGVLVADTEAPNAFTAGVGNHTRILFTTGLLDRLPRDEVRAVAAHELGHVVNRDVSLGVWAWAISSWVASVAAAVAVVAAALMWFFGFMHNSADDERDGWVGIGLMITGLIGMCLGALLRLLVSVWSFGSNLAQLAFSRDREFLADATGAAISRDPDSLAAALATLAQAPATPGNSAMVGRFCIVTPAVQGGGWSDLLSTHPSTEKRIQALHELQLDDLPVLTEIWGGVGSVNWILPIASMVLMVVLAIVIPAIV